MPMQKRSSMGRGLGLGHTGNTKLPPIVERRMRYPLALTLEPGTKAYMMGQCSILSAPPFAGVGWHLSIAHPNRYPTWDEIAKAWYETIPDADTRRACMVLPRRDEYVNIHTFCFQVHELLDQADGLLLPLAAIKGVELP